MKELTLNGRTYLSTKRAADITGYTTDYVGQLARQGKVDAQLVGRNWYIGEDSIKKHKFGEVQVNIREEKDETPAPQLEVLMSSADEELQKEEDLNVVEEEVLPSKESALPEEEEKDVLEEMQNAWHGWHKAQQSVPTEEDEVFLTDEEEVSIPITRTDVRTQEDLIEEEQVEEREVAAPIVATPSPIATPVPSPLPVERSWAGTGLAVTAVLTLIFVGAVAATAGYVITRNGEHSFAGVFQGAQDYFLGVQRIEK